MKSLLSGQFDRGQLTWLAKMGQPKFKLCNHSGYTDEFFKIDEYKLKIKYDKIWGYHNESVPLKRGHQNSNFLATHARRIKFSG